MDINGLSCSQPEEIERAFVGFFQSLLTTCNQTTMEQCTLAITNKVSQEINGKLLATFLEIEV